MKTPKLEDVEFIGERAFLKLLQDNDYREEQAKRCAGTKGDPSSSMRPEQGRECVENERYAGNLPF